MRVCAVDIGSNSVRCLVGDVAEDGSIVPVERGLEITRLSEGMGKSRVISAAAEGRTVAALEKFLALAQRVKTERFVLFATHALREAENTRSFIEIVYKKTGLPIRILSGEEEAEWIHRGVASAVGEPLKDTLVIDIGGGSTEFISTGGCARPYFKSISLGCVRLTERFLCSDPPRETEVTALRDFIARTLSEGIPEITASGKRLIGAGGTITTAAALALKLDRYDPDNIHGSTLTLASVVSLFTRLAGMPLKKRKRVPGLEEKRADIIPGGLLILWGIMEFCGARDITVSDQGILYGALLSRI